MIYNELLTLTSLIFLLKSNKSVAKGKILLKLVLFTIYVYLLNKSKKYNHEKIN
jgi:hypothetical protein